MEPHSARRHLAAIVAADIAGYSVLMAENDEETLERLATCRTLIAEIAAGFGGRLFGAFADSAMLEFPSTVHAVRATITMQRSLEEHCRGMPEKRRLCFRMGINVGEVLTEGENLYGDCVNVAARLQELAAAPGICISRSVVEHLRHRNEFKLEPLGKRHLKNIAEPVEVYRVDWGATAQSQPTTQSVPEKPSIAVLPFVNMSGDAEDEYFSDGITEDITTALSKLRSFLVIARNSTSAYKGKAADFRQVAGDLGVRYVLEGSVRRAGDRLRVTGQLIDAIGGNHVWAERYDRAVADVFAVQDELTSSVVAAVEPQLHAAENERLRQTPPDRLDAWVCLVRSLTCFWRLTKADSHEALELLSHALKLDPAYARALAMHAWISVWNAHMGWSSLHDVLPAARERARKAKEIDRNDPWARLTMGNIAMFSRRHDEAVDELTASLDLNPNFALAYKGLGLALAYGGKGEEAIPLLEKATRLSPRDPFMPQILAARGFAHYISGEGLAGLELARRAVRESPEIPGYWRVVALCAATSGSIEEARAAMETVRRLQPGFSVAWVERDSPLVTEELRRSYCDLLRGVGLPET
jgi:TolB-like protein/class 3 adenylate cyclase/tetratricopeptide (TPR) repeat protein